jgi:hypothetical protein
MAMALQRRLNARTASQLPRNLRSHALICRWYDASRLDFKANAPARSRGPVTIAGLDDVMFVLNVTRGIRETP